jgi:hypothetical protein
LGSSLFLRRPITVNVVNWLDGQHIVNVIIWNQCCSEMFDFRLFVLHENTEWVRFSLWEYYECGLCNMYWLCGQIYLNLHFSKIHIFTSSWKKTSEIENKSSIRYCVTDEIGIIVFLTSVFRVSILHLELSISIPVFFSESHILATSPDEYWTHQKFQKYLQDSSN